MLLLDSFIAFLLGQTAPTDPAQRANQAVARVRQLRANADAPDSVARLAREAIKADTGVNVDRNPYLHLEDGPRLLACIVASIAQQTPPELILALWMKEATVNVYSEGELSGESAVTNDDDAKSMFIAMNFFDHLGSDIFTRYKTGAVDNTVLRNGAFATAHRDILDRANADLMALGAAKADYAKVMRERLTVTGGVDGTPFRVQPQGFYYPAMLSMSMAYFDKLRLQPDALFDEFELAFPLSNSLTYLLYNNGRGAKRITQKGAYAFIKSSTARAKTQNRGLDDFLLHTKIVGRPWEQPRKNLVRFDYYVKCYAPIFA